MWWLIDFLHCAPPPPLKLKNNFHAQRNKGKVLSGDDVIQELAIQTANEQLRFIPAIYVCTRIWGTAYFLFTRYPEDRHLRAFDWLMIIKVSGCQTLLSCELFKT